MGTDPAARRRYYLKKKRLKLCTRPGCWEPYTKGSTCFCKMHLLWNKRNSRVEYQRKRRAGICVRSGCHEKLPTSGYEYTRCPLHMQEMSRAVAISKGKVKAKRLRMQCTTSSTQEQIAAAAAVN